jgi:murein DD-endopeptidase MepM/ murein hydrolase activator NlpD
VPGKAYNAGTIFLQVVPVFHDAMRSIQQETKGINKALGDEMEKGGREAGQRAGKAASEEMTKAAKQSGKDSGDEYAGAFQKSLADGMRRAQREVAPIKMRLESNDLRRELAEIKAEMKALGDAKIGVDFNDKDAYRRLAALQSALDALHSNAKSIEFKTNIDEVRKHVDATIARIEKSNPQLILELDTKPADRAMGYFEQRVRKSARTAANSLSREMGGAVGEIRAELAALADVSITPNVDATQARARVAELSAELKALANDENVDIEVRADAGQAYRDLIAINTLGNQIDGQHWRVTLDLNERETVRRMSSLESQIRKSFDKAAANIGDNMGSTLTRIRSSMEDFANQDITPDLDVSRVEAEALGLAGELAAIFKDQHLDAEVRVDAAAAYRDLVPLLALFASIDGRQLDVQVDVDAGKAIAQLAAFTAAAGGASSASNGLASSQGVGANSFRSFNAVLLIAVLLLPALIPMIAALGGAILALVPILGAAAAGIGVLLVGFSGIPNALKALSAADKASAKDAEAAAKKMKTATRGVEDAERSLARARQSAAQSSADAARAVEQAQHSAAEAIRNALRQQADAERNLSKAQRDATKAQNDLREARKKAEQELQDAADKRRQNAVDIRQALVDVFQATVQNTSTQQDPGATNLEKEQAAINLEQARIRLEELRQEQASLADEKAKTDKQGLAGTNAMQTAQDNLVNALERQKAAELAVRDAARAVREARVNGARQIADAIRSQQRAELQGQQSIGDAQRNLTQAQEDYKQAVYETSQIGSAAMVNLRDAMAKLGPAGRDFALFLYSLRSQFQGLRADIQEAMLPGVTDGLKTIIGTYAPAFRSFAVEMASTLGDIARSAGEGLASQPWQDFFATIAKYGPGLLKGIASTTGNWMTVLARLFTIVAPYAERLNKAMLGISQHAVDWMSTTKGTKFWTDFMDYAARVGPDVVDFFVALWDAIVNLGKALAPWGEIIMKGVTALLNLIAAIPPKWLGFILASLAALFIAFQALTGVVVIMAVGAIIEFAGAIAVTVGAVVAIIGVIIAAYVQFKTFRDIVNGVARVVGKVLLFLWQKVVVPVFEAIVSIITTAFNVISWTWSNVLAPIFDVIIWYVKLLWTYWSTVFNLIWGIVSTVFKAIVWYWKNILGPVFDLIGHVVWDLWKLSMKPVFALIKSVWKNVGDGISLVWKNVIKPVFDAFKDHVLPKLQSAFETAVGAISSLWNGLKEILATPIRFVIDTIINKGLIDSFNWVAEKVGSRPMKHVPMPDGLQKKTPAPVAGGNVGNPKQVGYARGGIPSASTMGVYPGYTPGRDVGYIGISGGEAIMRPEFTRAVSPQWVEYWNSVARAEGVGGVKRRLGAKKYGNFKRGGIVWPVPGHQISTYRGHDGVDINRGSGWDDFGDPIRSATPGRISYVGWGHGYGDGIFVDTPYGTLVYGHTSAQYVKAGQAVNAGTLIGAVGNTGNSSAPHLHFGFPGGTYDQALAVLSGAADSGDGGLLHTLGGILGGIGDKVKGVLDTVIASPAKWLLGKIEGKLGNLTKKFGDNEFVDMLTAVPKAMIHGMADAIKSMLGLGGDSSSTGGTEEVINAVHRIAAGYGWGDGAQWKALSRIIEMESGWDPNAANPSSSARGLFQKMTSIYGPVEDTPEGQAKWGMKYILDRYGSPARALAFHEANGYYARGGVVGETHSSTGGLQDNGTMMYDNGGYLPPGLTTVVNLTGKPEPVFTSDQFDRMGRSGGAGVHYEPHFHKSDLTARDVAFDLDLEFRRLSRRGGRYAERS